MALRCFDGRRVKLVNDDMRLFDVETDNGFTVLEVLDTDHVEAGDVVSGSLESMACDSLFSYTRAAMVELYVRDIVATLEAAETN